MSPLTRRFGTTRGWPIMGLWAASAAVITVGAGIVFFLVLIGGVQPALRDWEREVGRSVTQKYVAEIERLLAFTGNLNADDLEDYLMPQSDPSRFLLVFNAEREPIYWYHGGRSRVVLPTALPEEVREPQIAELGSALRGARLSGIRLPDRAADPLSLVEEAGLLTPFGDGPEPVGYLAAGTLGYESTAENRGILDAFLEAFAVAILATAAASIIVVLSFSSRLERGLASLSTQIHAVTDESEGSGRPRARRHRIREYRVLSAEIAELSRRLEQERRLRRHWALDIAHDLRTPLAGIRAQLEAVRDGVLDLDDERVHLLLGGVENLEALTQSFLLLTRVEAPDYRVDEAPVDLTALLSELHAQFHPRFTAAGRELQLEIGEGLRSSSVSGDRTLLARAVSNLLENALRHGATGPVRLRVRAGERLCVSVENTGSIAEELRANLFDRFARANTGGHGLGLALVDAIARVHGGETHVETGEGQVEIGFCLPELQTG